jgi:hypothetical protein
MARFWHHGIGQCWARYSLCFLVSVLACTLGCRKAPVGTTDPEAKLRLERVMEVYRLYADQYKKSPPNEQALKEFIRKLPKEQKDSLKLSDDIDSLFVSPQDGQKYVIRYGVRINPGGETEAIAWEQNGKDGNRFVYLSVGYVEKYDEGSFAAVKKK